MSNNSTVLCKGTHHAWVNYASTFIPVDTVGSHLLCGTAAVHVIQVYTCTCAPGAAPAGVHASWPAAQLATIVRCMAVMHAYASQQIN